MSPSQTPYGRLSQSLLVLRSWSILWIVAYHLMGNTRGYVVLEDAIATLSQGSFKNSVESALALFLSAGATGVNVFLIISGFGLTASWWKKYGSRGEKIPLMAFWKKRFVRIFPPFWAAVAIAIILFFLNPAYAPFGQNVWHAGGLSSVFAIFTTLTTLRNFVLSHYYFLNGAWWYVGLSIQLYLVFPLLVRFGQRYGWLKLLIASLLFSLTYRAVFLFSGLDTDQTLIPLAFFPSRLFEFTFGIYLAATTLQQTPLQQTSLQQTSTFRLNRWLLKAVPLSAVIFLIGLSFKWLPNPALNVFSEAIIGVGLFYTLVGLAQIRRLQTNRFFGALGRHSYGIYLTHMNAYLVLWPLAADWIPSYWLRFGAVAIACCAVGIFFEKSFSLCYAAILSMYEAKGFGSSL